MQDSQLRASVGSCSQVPCSPQSTFKQKSSVSHVSPVRKGALSQLQPWFQPSALQREHENALNSDTLFIHLLHVLSDALAARAERAGQVVVASLQVAVGSDPAVVALAQVVASRRVAQTQSVAAARHTVAVVDCARNSE